MPGCSLRFVLVAEHAQLLGRERCLCVHDVWQRHACVLHVTMGDHPEPKWLGTLRVGIVEPRRENGSDGIDGRSRTFVSYGVVAETTLPHFARSYMATRKRFRDFEFLHDTLARDFPACVIPPLPDKHNIESFAGDRFSDEFVQRRCAELRLFMERICRHPTLQRARILQLFLESSEWYIDIHSQRGHPIAAAPGALAPDVPTAADSSSALLESLSDSVMNAFSRVRKPDPQFVAMSRALDQQEDSLMQLERVISRMRFHTAGTYSLTQLKNRGLTHTSSGASRRRRRVAH